MMMGGACGLVLRQEIEPARATPFVAKYNPEATPVRPHIRRVRPFQGGADCERAGQYARLSRQQRYQAKQGLKTFQQRTTAIPFEFGHSVHADLNVQLREFCD